MTMYDNQQCPIPIAKLFIKFDEEISTNKIGKMGKTNK